MACAFGVATCSLFEPCRRCREAVRPYVALAQAAARDEARCWVPGCSGAEPMRGHCASCGQPVCEEHGEFNAIADEVFCNLAPEAFRFWETITLCDPILATLRGAALEGRA